MSDDLTPTIERLRTALRETAAQVEFVAPDVRPVAPRSTHRHRAVFVAAAAVTAAAIGIGVVVLCDNSDGAKVATTPSTTNQRVVPGDLSVGDADVEVYMDVDATDDEIRGVEQHLIADPRVARYTFLNKRDAFAEFAELFSDQPSLVENVSPDDLPTSFRVRLRDPADRTLEAELAAMPGVNDTSRSPGAAVPAD